MYEVYFFSASCSFKWVKVDSKEKENNNNKTVEQKNRFSFICFLQKQKKTLHRQSNNKLNRSNCVVINMCVLRTWVLFVSFHFISICFIFLSLLLLCCCLDVTTQRKWTEENMENMDYIDTAATVDRHNKSSYWNKKNKRKQEERESETDESQKKNGIVECKDISF